MQTKYDVTFFDSSESMFIGSIINAAIISVCTDSSFDLIVSKDFCCVEQLSRAAADQETPDGVDSHLMLHSGTLIRTHYASCMCEKMMLLGLT